MTEAPPPAPSAQEDQGRSFRRLWLAFGTARVGAGGVLALLLALALPESRLRTLAFLGCALYLALALALRLGLSRPTRDTDPRWLATVGLDLLAVSALQQLPGINYTPLFALPVLMAAVLGGAALAYGTAAAATGLLLLEALASARPGQAGQELLQTLLTSAALFALALLAHQLALRLRREESRSRQNEAAARMQAEVNALVIQALPEGVLVVDRRGWVQTANPTACALLGRGSLPGGFSLVGEPAWSGLLSLAREAVAGRSAAPRELRLGVPGATDALGAVAPGRRLLVRTALAAPAGSEEPLCLMLLQDLREIEARLRTEKLAAMGRMSAAVAHEIRNPLAAISHANALLAEDLQDAALRPLTALVDQNAQRLARIVEDVLDVARVDPGSATAAPTLALDETLRALCGDWGVATGSSRLQLSLAAGPARVAFDPEHLRRVLGNLLDNAQRHASDAPDAVRVASAPLPGGGAQLVVWSEGAPLDPSVQAHLFEPFFSSSSRSSGLGLFICRELCLRHGAQIGYQRMSAAGPAAAPGNAFIIRFAPAPASASATTDAPAAATIKP